MKLKESNELKQSGLKNTKHRNDVFELIKKSEQPVSAEYIFSELNKNNCPINLSTVYRILDTLCLSDLVTKVSIDTENKNLYEYNCVAHRHYMVCLGCDKILTVKNCPLHDYEKQLIDETEFIITCHKLVMYGYCPQCKRQQND